MPPIFVLADLFGQAALHRFADSALPDAPVRPYVKRTKRAWRFSTSHRKPSPKPSRRPAYALAATGRNPGCYSN